MPQSPIALGDGTTPELERATELFTRHSAGVYRYCLRRLGSKEEAEDAVQATYLNAWRSLKSGFEPDHQRPWLLGIASNVCSTSLRSELGGKRPVPRDPAALDALVARDASSADELFGLSEALRQLPIRQRRALVLRDWQGLSYKEIAAELAVSVASVETLLFRGRKKIATTLANADWRKVAPSARALVIWPFVFLRTKSAATAGTEHLKFGVALAGGTVAPLVAFGVIQAFLPGTSQPSQSAHSAPVVEVKSAQAAGSVTEKRSLHRGFTSTASTPERAASLSSGGPKEEHVREAKDGVKDGPPPQSGDGPPPQSGAGPPPNVEPNPPPADNSKVTVCHKTHSEQNPGVTIDVSGHAANGHRDDSPGAC